MSTNVLERLNVLFGADTSELDRALSTVGDKVTRTGKSITRFGSQLSTRLTLPLAAVGTAAFKMAADAEESANKFNVVMGDAATDVRARLQELTTTIPLTRSEMEGLAAGMQDMLVPMGLARGEAAHMSADMVKLAGDLGSFNNVGTDEVLMAMQSALAGSSEPMRRFGVDTRVTRLETLALKEGIIEHGDELDNTTTALAVMAAIQADSTDAMGDAARTTDSATNSVRFLWRDIKQLAQDIGNELIPIMTPMIGHLRDAVEWFGNLSPEVKRIGVIAGIAAAALGPLIMGAGGLVGMVGAITTLVPVITGSLLPAIGAIAPLLIPLGAAIAAGILAWQEWGGEIKLAVAAVINVVGPRLQSFVQDLGRLWDTARNWIRPIADFVVNASTWLGDKLGAVIDYVLDLFDKLPRFMQPPMVRAARHARDMGREVAEEMRRMRDEMETSAGDGTEAVQTAFEGLQTDLPPIATDTADEVAAEFRRMAEVTIATSESMRAGVTTATQSMRDEVLGNTQLAVSGAHDEFRRLNEGDDSPVAQTQVAASDIIGAFKDLGIEVPKEIGILSGEVDTKWGQIIDTIGDVTGVDLSGWEKLRNDFLSIIIDPINKALQSAVNWLADIFSAAVTGGEGFQFSPGNLNPGGLGNPVDRPSWQDLRIDPDFTGGVGSSEVRQDTVALVGAITQSTDVIAAAIRTGNSRLIHLADRITRVETAVTSGFTSLMREGLGVSASDEFAIPVEWWMGMFGHVREGIDSGVDRIIGALQGITVPTSAPGPIQPASAPFVPASASGVSAGGGGGASIVIHQNLHFPSGAAATRRQIKSDTRDAFDEALGKARRRSASVGLGIVR